MADDRQPPRRVFVQLSFVHTGLLVLRDPHVNDVRQFEKHRRKHLRRRPGGPGAVKRTRLLGGEAPAVITAPRQAAA